MNIFNSPALIYGQGKLRTYESRMLGDYNGLHVLATAGYILKEQWGLVILKETFGFLRGELCFLGV